MIRVVLANDLHDLEFSLRVDLGHEIVVSLLSHVEAMQAIQTADDDLAGAAGRTNGDIEHWLHGDLGRVKEQGRGASRSE